MLITAFGTEFVSGSVETVISWIVAVTPPVASIDGARLPLGCVRVCTAELGDTDLDDLREISTAFAVCMIGRGDTSVP